MKVSKFDFSAQFAGNSLNKELPTGLDITIPIIGVQTRFGQGKTAFTADIEQCITK